MKQAPVKIDNPLAFGHILKQPEKQPGVSNQQDRQGSNQRCIEYARNPPQRCDPADRAITAIQSVMEGPNRARHARRKQ